MKKFFGEMFIDNEVLKEEHINYSIKLEYYQIINDNTENENKLKYGVEVEKTEYRKEGTISERGVIESLTNNEDEIKEILKILMKNEVTPVGLKDVIEEIFGKNLQIAKN